MDAKQLVEKAADGKDPSKLVERIAEQDDDEVDFENVGGVDLTEVYSDLDDIVSALEDQHEALKTQAKRLKDCAAGIMRGYQYDKMKPKVQQMQRKLEEAHAAAFKAMDLADDVKDDLNRLGGSWD